MKNRTDIYRMLVKQRHEIELLEAPCKEVPDRPLRKANAYAVQNTERVYQEQFANPVESTTSSDGNSYD